MAPSRLPVFQERFKELRGDLTQAQFADKLGLSRPTIGLYESGARIPDAEVLRTIAICCNVSVDYLLGLSSTPAVSEDMRTAVKVTGLTEKAIENARQCCFPVNGTESRRRSILSKLMETDGFCELIVDIEELCDFVEILDTQYSHIVAGMEMKPDGNPIYQASIPTAEQQEMLMRFYDIVRQASIPTAEQPYMLEGTLMRFYDIVRLEKYELRDAFAAILEKLIPTAELLSSVKKILRECGGLSASSSIEGGEEHGGE